jgi:hypothetical protein
LGASRFLPGELQFIANSPARRSTPLKLRRAGRRFEDAENKNIIFLARIGWIAEDQAVAAKE